MNKTYISQIFQFDSKTLETTVRNILVEKENDCDLSSLLDEIIRHNEGIDQTFNYHNLLHLACFELQDNIVKLLLEKGANPNKEMKIYGHTPKTILFQTRYTSRIGIVEAEKKRKNILRYLLQYGMSFSISPLEIPTHPNIYELAKYRNSLSLLKEIENQKKLLNEEQRKEWNMIRFQYILR